MKYKDFDYANVSSGVGIARRLVNSQLVPPF